MRTVLLVESFDGFAELPVKVTARRGATIQVNVIFRLALIDVSLTSGRSYWLICLITAIC